MIEWLKVWTNQIIVAVIISVIFELIIPNGKNKKYIKLVINLYVLFTIINPIITKFINNNELELFQYNYEDYFDNNHSIITKSEINSDAIIKTAAEKAIKEDIKNKLALQGYKVNSISIDINNSNYEEYTQVNWIKLNITKEENLKENSSTNLENKNVSVQINAVEEVNILNEKEEKKKTLRNSEIKKIKEIISKEYNILEDNIEIN